MVIAKTTDQIDNQSQPIETIIAATGKTTVIIPEESEQDNLGEIPIPIQEGSVGVSESHPCANMELDVCKSSPINSEKLANIPILQSLSPSTTTQKPKPL
ncbi:ribose-5-phosphate isomerase A [Striga asiatica]|uniref:Ribose-5-phosphate isomerase A n=1 Tax=Striga asiatica TaxID=4170 RepID=A0A5A7PSD6_STRAF|nr:ribose-5-phosphate isomerase A [Striga asiatica]